jgi:glycosyltransferase involved in cell wall biosynthesis
VRVLHVGKFYPPHAGGVERHLAELAQAQVTAGLDVACLVHATPGVKDAPVAADGPLVERVPCLGQLLFAPVSPTWPLRFGRLLRHFRPDLLHVHVPNPSAFWMLGSRAAARIPIVLHWHADIPEDSRHRGLRWAYPPYRRFEGALNARAARIVATSAAYLDASRALGRYRAKCEVIPLGLAAAGAAAAAPAWPAGDLRVLAVGRLSYYKGFDVLLDAIARCPQASLVLIGDGEQRGALEGRVADLGLAHRVRLVGGVDDATLEAAYRACDLFCLPSVDRAEAFGMVLLEAMRAGKPLLVSDIPGSGTGTVVEPGHTGLTVPPRDADALAAAFGRLAAAPAERAAMGRAGRQRWEAHYRIDAVTRRWIGLYRDVLGRPTAG